MVIYTALFPLSVPLSSLPVPLFLIRCNIAYTLTFIGLGLINFIFNKSEIFLSSIYRMNVLLYTVRMLMTNILHYNLYVCMHVYTFNRTSVSQPRSDHLVGVITCRCNISKCLFLSHYFTYFFMYVLCWF